MKGDAPDDPYQKIKNILVVSVSMNCIKSYATMLGKLSTDRVALLSKTRLRNESPHAGKMMAAQPSPQRQAQGYHSRKMEP